MTTQQIGILGGTFDPIHLGHLAIAEDVHFALNLDQILLIPAAYQPLKRNQPGATGAQRLAMVQAACADYPHLVPSDVEISRPGPSYTVTTLEQLSVSCNGTLHLILGADALNDLPRWHNVNRVIALARIVAVKRPGTEPRVEAVIQALPSLADRLTVIEGPRLDIASTDIRERIRSERPFRSFLPVAVADYIAAHGLYRDL